MKSDREIIKDLHDYIWWRAHEHPATKVRLHTVLIHLMRIEEGKGLPFMGNIDNDPTVATGDGEDSERESSPDTKP